MQDDTNNTGIDDPLVGARLDPDGRKVLQTFGNILAMADLHIVTGEYLLASRKRFDLSRAETVSGLQRREDQLLTALRALYDAVQDNGRHATVAESAALSKVHNILFPEMRVTE